MKEYFSDGGEVLFCLFPFQKQVFADHYNWEANLRLTYPLLSTVRWKDISGEVGFHSLNRLAKAILGLESSFEKELIEYCEWKKIGFPDFAADKIPAVMLIPLIRYFKQNGLTEIWTKKSDRFPGSETKAVVSENKDEFEVYEELKDAKVMTTDTGIEILLPDYDCPYAILKGSKESCAEIVNACKIEYLNTNCRTQLDWWNEDEE